MRKPQFSIASILVVTTIASVSVGYLLLPSYPPLVRQDHSHTEFNLLPLHPRDQQPNRKATSRANFGITILADQLLEFYRKNRVVASLKRIDYSVHADKYVVQIDFANEYPQLTREMEFIVAERNVYSGVVNLPAVDIETAREVMLSISVRPPGSYVAAEE